MFSPDQQTALSRVSSAGGTPQPMTTFEAGEKTQRWPQILPGGKAVLDSSLSPAGKLIDFNQGNLVVQALPNGARKVVARGGFFGRYMLSGHLLYLRDDTLFAAPFDRERLELTWPHLELRSRIMKDFYAVNEAVPLTNSTEFYRTVRKRGRRTRPLPLRYSLCTSYMRVKSLLRHAPAESYRIRFRRRRSPARATTSCQRRNPANSSS